MRTEELDYPLPDEQIAQEPPTERDGARLLVVDAGLPPGDVSHRTIRDLPSLLPEGALVVVNDTRVIPARLFGVKRASGGRVELLLLDRTSAPGARETWRALGRASKGLRPGATIDVSAEGAAPLTVRVLGETLGSAGKVLSLELDALEGDVTSALERLGTTPLPPYVRRPAEPSDRERYQTVYARVPGAVAAPTAGLHLSEAVLRELDRRGVERASVTLHVGAGTFLPVTVDELDAHDMHEEALSLPTETALAIERARARGAAVVAVGTTVVRALEAAADPERPGHVRPTEGRTKLLIQPPYRARVVDVLLTNFHMPRSTLLALVFALGGTERLREAYRVALAEGYRFGSYGDAMLLTGRGS